MFRQKNLAVLAVCTERVSFEIPISSELYREYSRLKRGFSRQFLS
jgi:hypothetical protein